MSLKKSAAAIEVDWFDLDLERDMPTTAEDVAALDRARLLQPLPPGDYQRWIDLIEAHHPLPSRNNTDADEPFEL
jgi:hypothetical protein